MRVTVAGHTNVETSVPVEGFPITYAPVRYPHGSRTVVSGVGWNVAAALAALGDDVRLVTVAGPDAAGETVRAAAEAAPFEVVIEAVHQTPVSVVLYEPSGRRAIFSDVTGVAGTDLPAVTIDTATADAHLAVMCNVSWTRPHLQGVATRGIPIATDLHAIEDLDADYDQDYLAAAEVVFLSSERLREPPETVAAEVHRRFGAHTVGIGLGAAGALLSQRDRPPTRVQAPALREVVATTGGGDALFAAFLHFSGAGFDAVAAMRRAVVFAAWKVGDVGGSEGFLDAVSVERIAAGPQGGQPAASTS